MLEKTSLDNLVSLTDLCALKLAASPLERLRDELPEQATMNICRQYEVIGVVQTGSCSLRRVPGDARQVLAWALALMEPHQLLALKALVGDAPSKEQMAVVGEYCELIARETIVRPSVRGAVNVEVIS
jgi:hypothetical protein